MSSGHEVDAFRRMLALLDVTPSQLLEVAQELGIPGLPSGLHPSLSGAKTHRPPIPATMLGLECAVNPTELIAVGDVYSETGFNDRGNMTLVINTPTEPLGAVEITKEQAKALRDFLTSKLEE